MIPFVRAARLAAMVLAAALGTPAIAAEADAPAPVVTVATAALPVAAITVAAPSINPAFLSAPRAAPPLLNVPALPRGLPTPVIAPKPAAFASLEDAVAAHGAAAPIADAEAERCLASAIFFESKGEPLSGQLGVAQVVVNRARSGRFADDVCGVVKQRGQFSFVRGGRIPAIDAGRPAWRTAIAVARVALAEAWDSVAPRALYFHARAAGVRVGMTRVASIGNHVFFR